MSDLSRLLDDVYGTSGEPAPTSGATVTAARSAGRPPEATPGRRELVGAPDPVEALEAILDLGAAERHAAAATVVLQAPAPAPAGRRWCRSDDDILPGRPPRRGLRLRRR